MMCLLSSLFVLNFVALCDADTGLRVLLQNELNQDIITHLGTRYEIVHPLQIRSDWEKGLSTKLPSNGESGAHLQQTSFLIETREVKLHLDLELNKDLFAPTLVQFLFLKDVSPIAIQKLPENCYYHGKVRNHPRAVAALQTCHGLRGAIFLEKKTYFIHPLHGNHSENHPHLLYHYLPEDIFECANKEEGKDKEDPFYFAENDATIRNKYIEAALVFDQKSFETYNRPPSDVAAAAVEMINYVDLIYRPLNTSVNLVYLELWLEDQMKIDSNITNNLNGFREYGGRRINRISIDTALLLTSADFDDNESGHAFLDSICTTSAIGITKIRNIYQPHLTSFVLAHMIGHNLGIKHDSEDCRCADSHQCIMGNNIPYLSSTVFSDCSVDDYYKMLSKGHGACLFNMPTMRMSVCGNGVQEDEEECDCGTMEECVKSNPCCDPMTCKLIKHAECSAGACCKKCKLLSPDFLCRPSKGECDIPEFCDGKNGQCPENLYKRNGAVCSGGLGYCYQGICPVLKKQCQNVWGEDAEAGESVCYERINVLGTPNGNCGEDFKGKIHKCTFENSYCGSLQCSQGEKVPLDSELPVQFIIHKVKSHGVVYECKARTLLASEVRQGLVKDGTKCGFQKFCLNQTCTSIRNVVSGKCPLEDEQNACSGHGVCTNLNSCFCDEGWMGSDCSEIDEESRRRSESGSSEYYDSIESSQIGTPSYGHNELNLDPNLAITVITASVVIGVGLVVIIALFFYYRTL
ncbi:zinc metalloproteinase-disintegrin-like EoMP06 isoform X2 [Uloborus diversus]|uniref:zinc metalloproteinase-disintegrin-like EoMP06 isoform X2 n=1 Tax=Uloborus diversus TaxID=327109 RepID=UPI00240A490F|nr:zinc metalloproteinase-disintegrin-like EoMP06 isoform X2 [Uloborus diversus]